jgi:chloramphenicol-sensitive protein RarD
VLVAVCGLPDLIAVRRRVALRRGEGTWRVSSRETGLTAADDSVAAGLYALAAYGLWGILPIYWKRLDAVAPVEIVANRVVWSVLVSGVLVLALGRRAEIRTTLRSPRHTLALVASGALVAGNWGLFIWSVVHDRLVEASFGYYLNPLVNVAFGMLLGERLTRMQGVAIGVAALGVLTLATEQGGAPWIPLALAISFGLYGLVRKLTPVSSATGLFFETTFLAPVALGYLAWLIQSGGSELARGDLATRALLASTGVVTAVPLLLFAGAARRLRLTTLGLIQYLSPSLSFLLAVFAYGEPFGVRRALAFALIWLAVALYSAESLRGATRAWLTPE